MSSYRDRFRRLSMLMLFAAATAAGCTVARPGSRNWAPAYDPCESPVPPADPCIPRELCKTAMPEYVIEVSDILLIDALNVTPKPPYRIGTLDLLNVRVDVEVEARPETQLDGQYAVMPGGSIDLAPFGSANVKGMTIEEARQAVEMLMRQHVTEPKVTVSLAETAAQQQIAGEHMVIQDGTVNLGLYGKVYVTGLTEMEARKAIETHLAQYIDEPKVAVDVYSFNSKKYYIVTDGGGLGDGVYPFPITGNETVLDAISQINGLDSVSSSRIWVARPAPRGARQAQVLPVDWYAITALGDTSTNYQLMPGDRVYVAADKLVKLDTMLSKVSAPMERIFGTTLLGTSTVQRVRNIKSGGTGGGFF